MDLTIYNHIKEVEFSHKISTCYSTGYTPPYHSHDEYEVYLLVEGNATLYVEDQCYIPSYGDLIIIYPGAFHRNTVIDAPLYERICINVPLIVAKHLSSGQTNLCECLNNISNEHSKSIRLSSYNVKKFIHLTDRVINNLYSTEYGDDLMSMMYYTKLLIFINDLFKHSEVRKHDNIMPTLVINTMKYIEENITGELTLEKLSMATNYSPNYLRVQFKHHTGISLREYILDKRIELAKKLLTAGKSVSDTCNMSGFNDYANFIRSFKKKTGCSPGHYIKS